MLNTGRAAEFVAARDGPAGLLGLRPGRPFMIARPESAPIVTPTLCRRGRTAEADALLAEADAAIRSVHRRDPVPFSFDADAAAVAAPPGDRGQAMALLEHAYARGWRHLDDEDLPSLRAEPAFASLHNEPRFEAIEARLATWQAQEKREMAALVAAA